MEPTWESDCQQGIGPVVGAPHGLPEVLVHLRKGLALMGQLALDVRCRKDALQVHPALLAGHPGVQGLAEQAQLAVHALHIMLDAGHKPAAAGVDSSQMTEVRLARLVMWVSMCQQQACAASRYYIDLCCALLT